MKLKQPTLLSTSTFYKKKEMYYLKTAQVNIHPNGQNLNVLPQGRALYCFIHVANHCKACNFLYEQNFNLKP